MKQYFFKIRSVIYSMAITGILIATSATVFANKNDVSPVATKQATVAFVEADEASALFHVTFNAENTTKFELTIRDVNGDVLFRDTYETDNFSRYVKFMTDGGDVSDISFNIRTIPTGISHTFNVNSSVKMVQDVTIKKQ